MKLDETNFYEKKLINKRKNLILEGKDPDEVEEEEKQRKKRKRKKKNKDDKNSQHQPESHLPVTTIM
jgi:ATP-dependent RNA helicase DDX49/DBP8